MTKLKIRTTKPEINSQSSTAYKNRLSTESITDFKDDSQFLMLFENLISGGIIYRPDKGSNDFIVVDVNLEAENIEKINKEELIGKQISVVFPGVKDSGLFQMMQKVNQTGEPLTYSASQDSDPHINGWREYSIFKLLSGDIVVLFNDLTIQKHIELALRDRLKELRCLCNISMLKEEHSCEYDEFFTNVVKLIPGTWQYPDITEGRIIVEDKIYQTANFEETKWKLSSNIKVDDKTIGKIEVVYLEEAPENIEGPFLYEEVVVINIFACELGKYVEHYKATEKINRILDDLEVEREVLKDKNIALKEVMNQIQSEKEQIAIQIQSNISKIAIPILNRLDRTLSEKDKGHISLLKTTLEEITNPFISSIDAKLSKLTPREIEICNMIKNGMNTKDIADMLHVSVETVRTQRKNIRSKLGITNQKTNLTTYLYSN